MPMQVNYRDAIANHGVTLITHIGLTNTAGTELSGGTPAYARKAVTWTAASSGTVRPTANLLFDIPAAGEVGGWRGYSALTAGTNYGGATLTQETFAAQGQYNLLAATSGILHTAT